MPAAWIPSSESTTTNTSHPRPAGPQRRPGKSRTTGIATTPGTTTRPTGDYKPTEKPPGHNGQTASSPLTLTMNESALGCWIDILEAMSFHLLRPGPVALQNRGQEPKRRLYLGVSSLNMRALMTRISPGDMLSCDCRNCRGALFANQ